MKLNGTVAILLIIGMIFAAGIGAALGVMELTKPKPIQPLTAEYILYSGFKKDPNGYFKPLPAIIIQQAKGADTLKPIMVMLPFNDAWILGYAENNKFVPVTVVSNRDQFDGWNETR